MADIKVNFEDNSGEVLISRTEVDNPRAGVRKTFSIQKYKFTFGALL
ncbi:hypothetical protein [uncultured Ruminococcus sp.]|nr:hypothetical protein [uncultured Ruminococcus sp.]